MRYIKAFLIIVIGFPIMAFITLMEVIERVIYYIKHRNDDTWQRGGRW